MDILDQAHRLAASGQQRAAVDLVQKAAEAGDAVAQYAVANWRLYGLNGGRDFAEAHRLLDGAVASGSAEAVHLKANLVANGTGVAPDPDAAVRLLETIEWLIGVFAAQSPGSRDDLLLLDSTPVECGRSVETARRSQLADVCGYSYSKSHSRWFWGMRLHLACAPDGTPRAAALVSADRPEREVALRLLPRALAGGETIVCDKGYAGREFANAVAELGAAVLRPPRQNEPQTGPHLAPIRQRIESVFWTCKDLLSLERHGARTPHNLFARIATRLLALAACISLNHQLGRPSRAIADYTA